MAKSAVLLIFAFFMICQTDGREGTQGIYTGPTTIVFDNSGVTSTSLYCDNYCTDGYCPADNSNDAFYLTACICECYKQGFDWYSYNVDTIDNLCTCMSKLLT